jgi:tetratricopeptide (TPR) repeat protein
MKNTTFTYVHGEYKKSCEFLKAKYKEMLAKRANSSTIDSLQLAEIFLSIAGSNIDLAENGMLELKLQYYNDATVACQYALKISGDVAQKTAAYQKLNVIQDSMVKLCGGDLGKIKPITGQNSLNDLCHRKQLQAIRDETKITLQRIESYREVEPGKHIYDNLTTAFAKCVESGNKIYVGNLQIQRIGDNKVQCYYDDSRDTSPTIKAAVFSELKTLVDDVGAELTFSTYIDESALLFKEIAEGMEGYLAGIYKAAEEIIGPAPCNYAVIGLGSMALRQMTPYSDLECAILTENDDYRQSGEQLIRDYFKNLSHLVHFMIINLGETTIPLSSYGVNLDKFIPQAVNFDLGGKTPVGRIEQDKPYELIQTVEGMLRYLKNDGQKTEHMDKNLAAIVQKICFVHGDQGLVSEYQSWVQVFLLSDDENGRPNCEARTIKALLEGVEEFDYTKAGSKPKLIEGNLKQFHFNPYEAPGKLFDVKQEIYRLPDRLIYNLGLIYAADGDSSWGTLDKLHELGKISLEGANNLKKALTFATNLRLKTYEHYGYHKETMDFSKAYGQVEEEELIEAISGTFKLKKEDLKPGGALFEYYKTVLPLHSKLAKFCAKKDIKNKDNFFGNEGFYSKSPGTVSAIHLRLLQYEKALEQQLLELEELKAKFGLESANVATSLNIVGAIYSHLGKCELALKYQLEALAMHEKLLGQEHPSVAASLNNVGSTYGELGKHEQALQYQLKALELRKKLLGQEHPDVAASLNNVGSTYGELGKHGQVLQYQLKALELRKKLLGQEHPDVAASLNNVGSTYGELGKHEQALQYQLEALELMRKLLGQEHPSVATSLNNVGSTYGELGKHKLALQYHLEALELRKKSLGQEHPDVAQSLNNIGYIYNALGKHELALQYHLKALELQKKLLGQEHPNVAISLNNVGGAYSDLGKYEEALKYQIEALELSGQLLGKKHPYIAIILNNLGMTWSDLGKYKEALKYQLEALTIREELLGKEHPDVAISLNNVGMIYGNLGQHELSLWYHLKALEMQKEIFGPEHPSVATNLNNVGSTYSELGKHELALQYQLQALELRKKLLGHEHPDVAISVNDAGATYGALGKYEQALQYHLEALELSRQLLGEEHPHVAVSLNNVGCTYFELGHYKQALRYCLEVLVMQKKLLGQEHPHVAASLHNVGRTYSALEKYELSLQYHLEALAMQKKLLGKEHPDIAQGLNYMGGTCGHSGNHELSLQYHLEALEMRKKLLGQKHPDVATSLSNMGCTYYALGKHDKAFQYCKEALELRKELLGPTHPNVLTIQQNLKFIIQGLELESRNKIKLAMEQGKEYYLKGKYQEAIEEFKKALNLPYVENNIKIPLLYNLARAHHQNKDLTQAMDYYNKVLELNSSHPKALNYIKELLADSAGVSTMPLKDNLGSNLTNNQLEKILDETFEVYQLETILNESLEIYQNSTLLTGHNAMPIKTTGTARIISYNITVDYFDEKDKTMDGHHHWKIRNPFVVKLLESVYPDIMCLQELSPDQALEMHRYFGEKLGYSSVFLSQTPAGIEAGLVAFGDQVGNWCGKRMGTPLLATFISSSCKFLEVNRFWLNEHPDQVPSNIDRGDTDKGFGNINSYRAVLWAKVQISDKELFVFNSHYPLSGGNKARLECVKLEMQKIKEIAQDEPWVSAGDRNIIPSKDDTELCNPAAIHNELAKHSKSRENGIKHYGINTTWLGFSYDEHQNRIKEGKFQDDTVLDVVISSLNPVCSFFLHGAFDPAKQELLPLLGSLSSEQNDGRYFASDHALVGMDFVWL